MKYEAAYGRQSIDKKDSISIETQIELCLREAKNPELVKVYTDRGYSGSNIERPDFQRLLRDIRAGLISKVIIYRLDRMSRSLLDFSKLMDMFKRYDVSFQSTQEKFDTSTPIGNAMLSITMVFAQLERETIQQRLKDNYYARGKKQYYIAGQAPFGLEKIKAISSDGKRVSILQASEFSDVVQSMYVMYGMEGRTLGEIARILNKQKTPTPRGGTWDTARISCLLRNPLYVKSDVSVYQYYKQRGCFMNNDPSEYNGCGCFVYGKRKENERKFTDLHGHYISVLSHEGIISAELFLKVQYKLDQNRQIDNTSLGKKSWLTGLVKCGVCSYGMAVKSSCKSQYQYWECTGRRRGCCDVKLRKARVDVVDCVVKDKLFELIRQHSDIIAVKDKQNQSEKNRLEARIEKLNQQADKLINALLEGEDVTAQFLNEKLKEIQKQKDELENKLHQILLNNNSNVRKPKQLLDVINDWDKLDNSQRKEIAFVFIDMVIIQEDTSIKIIWKYDFSAD